MWGDTQGRVQDLSGWKNRDPYSAGARGGPSLDTLSRIKALKGVGPNEVAYGQDEMELAFGQQADDAEAEIADYNANRIDPFGHLRSDPVLNRKKLDAIGGFGWKGFGDAIDRSGKMAANRGMRSRVDLVGEGPGSGTGIGRWMGQLGHANSAGSFTPDNGPAADLETLQDDAGNDMLSPANRSQAMRALQLLTRGR